MTVSGYRLPQQIPGQSMSQQQPQDGNGVISKTELNRSDSTIGISSDTTVTSLPVQQQQLGIMASLSGGLNRSTSLNDPTTHQRLSASSSNSSSSSSSAMIDMWVAANAAIKVEASSQHSNPSMSGPLIGDGSISPPTGISTPGSIKGKDIFNTRILQRPLLIEFIKIIRSYVTFNQNDMRHKRLSTVYQYRKKSLRTL